MSDDLGERPDGRSEPDVIAVWPDLVVVGEAKLGSVNDLQRDNTKFERYVDEEAFTAPVEEVAELGFYELVRNWRIGTEVAARLGAKRFELVNLGPAELGEDVEALRPQLRESAARRFAHRRWGQLLRDDDDSWLRSYATTRNLFER